MSGSTESRDDDDMSTVKIEHHDAGTYTVLIDGEKAGQLEYQAPTVWRARMTRYNAYTGREFTGRTHAQAFFDEQFGDKPVTYRWTIVWTDGTSQIGRAEGALAAYEEVASTVTHATSPQRAAPKKMLVYTVARVDGELSSTVHIGPSGQHELNADAAQFDPNRQDPGLPLHPPKTLASA